MVAMNITIAGAPYGKARHRITRTGIAYTPKETVSYESLVKHTFRSAFPNWKPTEEPVAIKIEAMFPIPKSASKKMRRDMIAGLIRPGKKPDWDNIGKVITDALNEILYRDDSLVVDAQVLKWYAEVPRVEVYIRVLP